jgi:ribosomal protein L7/L12
VIVFVNEVGVPFPMSLAGQSDEVKIGLPDEYADAVINGVARAAEAVGAPARRKLRFGWAAHGLVGSSPSIFEGASKIDCIVVIRCVYGMGLQEAKRAVHFSPAWSDVRQRDECLWDELENSVKKDERP